MNYRVPYHRLALLGSALLIGLGACSDSATSPTLLDTPEVSAALLETGEHVYPAAVFGEAPVAAAEPGSYHLISSNPRIAAVQSDGTIVTLDTGVTAITYSSGTFQATAPLRVTLSSSAAPTVTVTIDSASVAIGGTARATAEVRDASGKLLRNRTVTWSSNAPSIASVSSTGGVGGQGAGVAAISATYRTTTGSANIEVRAATLVTTAPAPVQAVAVALQPASITVGQTSTATVTLTDAGGNVLTGRSITYATSNAAIATVSGTGVVSGVAAGTVTVTATSEGKSGSATLTVANATTTTTTTTAAPAPLVNISFDGYASTAALKADCVTFQCGEDVLSSDGGQSGFSAGDIALDDTAAPPGGRKSMRYRYRHPGDGCNSVTLTRSFGFPARREVWAEFALRWSPTFSTANAACAPNDHKLIFGNTEGAMSGRWAFYVGSDSPPAHSIQQERPYPNGGGAYLNLNRNTGHDLLAEDLWTSGTWHTVRLHIRHSTTATSGDGAYEIWIDGVLRHQQLGFNTSKDPSENLAPDLINGFSLGRNKDDGPANVDMFLWWGPVKVYGGNPGW